MSPEVFQVELPSPTIEHYRDVVYAASSLVALLAAGGFVILKALFTRRSSDGHGLGGRRQDRLPSSTHP